MFSEAELVDAIEQITAGKHSIQNCERLAALYVVLDHLYGKDDEPMVIDSRTESEIGRYGDSQFLKAIAGKSAKEAWLLMDELVEAVEVFNPRLINSFFEKLRNL